MLGTRSIYYRYKAQIRITLSFSLFLGKKEGRWGKQRRGEPPFVLILLDVSSFAREGISRRRCDMDSAVPFRPDESPVGLRYPLGPAADSPCRQAVVGDMARCRGSPLGLGCQGRSCADNLLWSLL